MRRALLVGIGLTASLAVAIPVAAHPLGNFTVNRAVSVVVEPGAIAISYIVDMAEIPAFAAIQAMDLDGDGSAGGSEQATFAADACATAQASLIVQLDGLDATLIPADEPALTFPPGAGGLETLRLVCPMRAGNAVWGERDQTLIVGDLADDGHLGWHELTIAASAGVELRASDVPAQSPSALLTAYPQDSLDAPLDVREGTATLRLASGSGGSPSAEQQLAAGTPRAAASDPLAALAAGDLSLPAALLGLLLAVGLGAVHAISPGHGKTLVAAYLIGSRGSLRQAAGLGLTVAATHTAGVFLLGLVTLAAGELFVPEQVIGWLSATSGILVVLLGIGLVARAVRARPARGPTAAHDHDHEHGHDHAAHGNHGHAHELHADRGAPLRARNVVALGLAGGLVPSASALIVLLVAVTTGRLVLGLALIVAFGVGMALVLGGLAVLTTVLRRRVLSPAGPARHSWVRRLAAWVPLASGIAVTATGLAVTISAVARFG